MFCANCGKAVAEGLAFCTNCGSPAPKDDAPPAPEPTPVAAPVAAAPAAAAPTEVQPVAAPVAPAPPQYQPAGSNKPNRTGIIVGSIVAAVVVLAGVGVGLYFGLKGDSTPVTTTVTAPGADGTMETIPGLDGSTDGTAPGDIVVGDYLTLVQNLLLEMDYDNGRIPELADIINSTTPDVPAEVYDELNEMLGYLQTTGEALFAITPPPAFGEAHGYLLTALNHMAARIDATMQGIQAGWESGTTSAALPYYADGRDERDAYLAAIEDFYAYAPEDANVLLDAILGD